MKVKVGHTIYDGNKEPVMVILSAKDRQNITDMEPEATKYCSYPEGEDEDDILKWMRKGGIMGEIAYHEETLALDDGGRVYVRQVYGAIDAYLGLAAPGQGRSAVADYEAPDILVRLQAGEIERLHEVLSQMIHPHCQWCDEIVEHPDPQASPDGPPLLCDDCRDDPEREPIS